MAWHRTNNWDNYGGMDVYVSQLTGTDYHDYFYTNPTVIVSNSHVPRLLFFLGSS